MYRPLAFAPTHDDVTTPQLGGSAWLDACTPWPISTNGHPLLHLASFPATFIQGCITGLELAPGLIISIFASYIASGGHRVEEAMSHGGRVIAHGPGCEPACPPCAPLAPHRICAGTAMAEGEAPHGISKIGGRPCWLQDDESEGQTFVLQLDEFDLDKAAPTHRGILVGGMGYLLLDRNIQSASTNCGRFVIQTT